MSTTRLVLVLVQTLFNELASTPPNPTPEKGRYATDQLYIFRLGPLILRIQQLLVRLCTALEILFYLLALDAFSTFIPSHGYRIPLPASESALHLPRAFAKPTPLTPTPVFLFGVLLVVAGGLLRLTCFRYLGELFTFHLSVHPSHRLITSGPYSIVRHPAYVGSLSIIAGLICSHFTPGSWLWEIGPLAFLSLHPFVGIGSVRACVAFAFAAVWWLWTLGIGLSRVVAEDKQMCLLFQEEWDAYAARVRWWFIPGLI
ncbi:hypothetical protein MSAN_00854400 [Mycena sanguinolenta]|uniref:Protein-S-isoprenylcysteine O-methyltransferase n=1 Tax=Mycena sanguinolenta TaxID=230812 RepID=A0A8H6Z117_9AGAR|nr:hypothetical protein MSAN_00854400 [Mycena sanguinolenta]